MIYISILLAGKFDLSAKVSYIISSFCEANARFLVEKIGVYRGPIELLLRFALTITNSLPLEVPHVEDVPNLSIHHLTLGIRFASQYTPFGRV